eukprot:3547801-Lingulodinium_polyedra.AAC.1
MAVPFTVEPGVSIASTFLRVLSKPDEAPLVRRLPGSENVNLLATGKEVGEASVPVSTSGTSSTGAE